MPFTVTIPADERDKDLTEKLKAEWPGILHWMIDGSLAWQRDGLAPPQAVTEATGAYLEAEDALAAWIEEETQEDRNAFELSKDLFKSWTGWAERSGEYVGSEKRFSLRLEERAESFGITKQRDAVGRRGFRGRRLRRPVEQTVDDREKGAQPVGEKS